MYKVKKCGLKLKPPSLIVEYEDLSSHKQRCRTMPIRNFKKTSNISRAAEELKKNPRHQMLLKDVSQLQVEKMLLIIQETLKGASLDDAISNAQSALTVDPNLDLNKLDESKVEQAKRIMDEGFEQNQLKPGDEDFQYDVEVDFDNVGPVESSGWDDDNSEDNEF
nr:centrosomal protein of 19 kDa-like [Ciona intestinalis]|eukprot:XP_002129981.1 centrosomal protein of 19 kDa-like [Ciona intestinalis]